MGRSRPERPQMQRRSGPAEPASSQIGRLVVLRRSAPNQAASGKSSEDVPYKFYFMAPWNMDGTEAFAPSAIRRQVARAPPRCRGATKPSCLGKSSRIAPQGHVTSICVDRQSRWSSAVRRRMPHTAQIGRFPASSGPCGSRLPPLLLHGKTVGQGAGAREPTKLATVPRAAPWLAISCHSM